VIALEVQPDRVRLFVRVWPSDSAADVAKECKGVTSFALRREYPQLHKLPSMGTRRAIAGNVSQETIQRYINAQTGK
jgi:putative transposase